jgi:hypothetical protein
MEPTEVGSVLLVRRTAASGRGAIGAGAIAARIAPHPARRKRVMATKAKKVAPRKGKAAELKTGAGAATAARSKDAGKKTFGKAAPKTVKPATAKSTAKPAKSTKSASEKPSVATRVVRKVAKTATGAVTSAVATAASVIGKDRKGAKAKSK